MGDSPTENLMGHDIMFTECRKRPSASPLPAPEPVKRRGSTPHPETASAVSASGAASGAVGGGGDWRRYRETPAPRAVLVPQRPFWHPWVSNPAPAPAPAAPAPTTAAPTAGCSHWHTTAAPSAAPRSRWIPQKWVQRCNRWRQTITDLTTSTTWATDSKEDESLDRGSIREGVESDIPDTGETSCRTTASTDSQTFVKNSYQNSEDTSLGKVTAPLLAYSKFADVFLECEPTAEVAARPGVSGQRENEGKSKVTEQQLTKSVIQSILSTLGNKCG